MSLREDLFEDLEIPQELEASLQRHRQHLGQLVSTLKMAGVGEEQIEHSVSVIVASYKEELLEAIKMMRESKLD